MTILVACLGEDNCSWPSVFKLALMPEWEKVFLVGPDSVGSHLELKENMEFVGLSGSLEQQIEKLSGAVSLAFGEVGVSLFSGDGLLHMVVLSALLRSGCGIKLVHYSDKFVEL